MPSAPIVIIGGGHAAAQLCHGLADAGLAAGTTLVCAEDVLPYQRPPLSKGYLKAPEDGGAPTFRNADWYRDAGFTVLCGDPAIAIDRAAQRVQLRSGQSLPYAQLVLAMGCRPRWPAHLPHGLANVAALRSVADAKRLRALLHAARHVTVLGGGFIGLEVAASARALGKDVTVLESAPRLLGRAVSEALSAHVRQVHADAGIDIRLGVAVGEFETATAPDGSTRLAALQVDGVRTEIDLLLVGIGAEPETGLAEAAGLVCANGIEVDEFMRSSDPAILAVGDCAWFPESRSGRRLRLESVQNANDQARTALSVLKGAPTPYAALPTFWSDQGTLRLMMAGLLQPDATTARRPGTGDGSFTLFHYAGDKLICVESVNAPADQLAARKLLETGKHPAPAVVADPGVALKDLA